MSGSFDVPSPNCYNCVHRGRVPGSVHSTCDNPMAVVTADQHGIRMGWFAHPFDFDPCWLTSCDGFAMSRNLCPHGVSFAYDCEACDEPAPNATHPQKQQKQKQEIK
jgi:hypothetical protein